MTTFSHSRLGSFEQCPLKYKYCYIDKIKTDREDTVEAFLGSRAHEALEKLYLDIQYQKLLTLKELIQYFKKTWKENWHKDIVINKEDYTEKNYFDMGVKYITNYYNKHKPFDKGTILGLETQDRMEISKDYKFHIRIDRLMDMGSGLYEVHDYKTNMRLPSQEKLDQDRQLAMYSYWVKKQYKDCKKIRLVWHFLAKNKEMESHRTIEQLETLRKEVLAQIKEIEQTKTFKPNKTALCPWCEYQEICPLFKHELDLEEKPVNEFLKDSGVKLVNEYAKTKKELDEFTDKAEEKLDKLKEALIAFAKKEGIEVIIGSDNKISIKEYTSITFPKKGSKEREALVKLLKKLDKWDEVTDLDRFALARLIKDDVDLAKKLDKFKTEHKSKRLSVSKR